MVYTTCVERRNGSRSRLASQHENAVAQETIDGLDL